MEVEPDIFGRALKDYFQEGKADDIVTWTNITMEDELPVRYLFRDYKEMPKLEQIALRKSCGRVLDVGCCAGSHSLYLQDKGFRVTGIDISKGAVEVCVLRGINDVRNLGLLAVKDEQFDTVLLLMNGTGIFGTLNEVPDCLNHLTRLLKPGGQILIDSTDLRYMFQEEPGILKSAAHYYGEVQFGMRYKGQVSPPFNWLYLDRETFKNLAETSGFNFEVIAEGRHYDYLARLTL